MAQPAQNIAVTLLRESPVQMILGIQKGSKKKNNINVHCTRINVLIQHLNTNVGFQVL